MKAEDILGMMEDSGLAYLRRCAAVAQCVIEIGCWHGRSTHALCETCPGVIHAIDSWQGCPEDDDPVFHNPTAIAEARRCFFANLRPFLDSGKLVFHEGLSCHVLDRLTTEVPVDFGFIDGSHDYASVALDIRMLKDHMRPGGILAGHDSDYEAVAKAVREWCPGALQREGRIWEWKVPK